jgi:hypothetical protein
VRNEAKCECTGPFWGGQAASERVVYREEVRCARGRARRGSWTERVRDGEASAGKCLVERVREAGSAR